MKAHPVRTREHLLHMLAEAAELEHNLLCSYLYAAFSLKKGLDEDILAAELACTKRWHAEIMSVCMEEMMHLAQVANLMVAVGSRPHFDRPNLPVARGYHPASIQISLAPFDMETLDHFIFLERPDTSDLEDAARYRAAGKLERKPEYGVLMPSAPDYATIGEFYGQMISGFEKLAGEMGERELFNGPPAYQLTAEEIQAPSLLVVTDLASATSALKMIIVQGEGAPAENEESHFEKFSKIKREYLGLSAGRAAFRPARNVAYDPVMRRPATPDRVHVNGKMSAPVLDASNAVYSLLLRCLTSVYDLPASYAARKPVLGCAMGLMKILAQLSDALTRLPAGAADGPNAGVTFAMLRATEGLAPGIDILQMLRSRLEIIARQIPNLTLPPEAGAAIAKQFEQMSASLERAGPKL